MNKLTILPIILLLVACQPSELERCVEANVSISNDYLDKEIELEKKILDIRERKQPDANLAEAILVSDWFDSLNTAEENIYFCVHASNYELPNPEAHTVEDFKPRINFCIENLILEQKNTATSICNSQGIY
ncbi:hypothetical protein OAV58_03145 [Gammaproteobacteria bacterium]|nr:hypothetical protein [Gammaproteobacteria bacterium]